MGGVDGSEGDVLWESAFLCRQCTKKSKKQKKKKKKGSEKDDTGIRTVTLLSLVQMQQVHN